MTCSASSRFRSELADAHSDPDPRAERGEWAGCIAGALSFDEYRRGLTDAAFVESSSLGPPRSQTESTTPCSRIRLKPRLVAGVSPCPGELARRFAISWLPLVIEAMERCTTALSTRGSPTSHWPLSSDGEGTRYPGDKEDSAGSYGTVMLSVVSVFAAGS